MDKFESLRAFTQVIEAGGFAAAARQMGLSRSQVNKLVVNLETSLGVQLLHRTTRRVTPTETGLAFYERCSAVLADLTAAENAVRQMQAEPRGRLRVNAPLSFGILCVGPALADFATQYPELQVELSLNDRFVDTIEEGFDLTLRISEPPEVGGTIAQRIAPIERVLCASPAYFTAHGRPESPDCLKDRSCLCYGQLPGWHQWRLYGEGKREWTVSIRGAVCSNNGDVLRQAALQGLGIALLPTFIVGEDLRRDRLQIALPGYTPRPLSLYILYPVTRHLSTKVQVFANFLRDRFSREFAA